MNLDIMLLGITILFFCLFVNSMMGEDISQYNIPDTAGIIPRFSQELFKIIEGSEEYSHTKVEISYFEIYNEKIHDLLGPSQNGRSAPLRVREHPELGPYVVDLTVHNVHSFETLQVLSVSFSILG